MYKRSLNSENYCYGIWLVREYVYDIINVYDNKCQACWKYLGFSLMKRKAVGISEMLNDLAKYTEDGPR